MPSPKKPVSDEPGSPDPAKTPAAVLEQPKVADELPPVREPVAFDERPIAVLLAPLGHLHAGQLVAGPGKAIAALIKAKGAREATAREIAQAATFIHQLPSEA
jgi:hypothetical protein